jgi:integrase
MGARNFYLYPKPSGIYYAQLILPCGGKMIWRSTRTKNRDEAAMVVAKWLIEGVPVAKGGAKKPLNEAADWRAVMKYLENGGIAEAQALEIAGVLKKRGLVNFGIVAGRQGAQNFIGFLCDFWDYEKSLYLRDKRAHGKSVTRRTCIKSQEMIKNKWEPHFRGKTLADVTRSDLRDFGLDIKEHLAGKTVNNILHVGIAALKWAHRERMISEDVTAGLGGFAGGEKERDIFTPAEIRLLEDVRFWGDNMAYAAFRLASTSALRSGEVMALRREDIGDRILHVRHSYGRWDGLKSPKNGKEGIVYLLPEVRALLIKLLTESPHEKSPKQFVFYSLRHPDKPCYENLFVRYLYKAMKAAGISPDGRNKLDFHSLRHYVATQWADKTGDLRQVAKVTRHKDLKMAGRYSDHTEEEAVAAMGEKAAQIFEFRKRGA